MDEFCHSNPGANDDLAKRGEICLHLNFYIYFDNFHFQSVLWTSLGPHTSGDSCPAQTGLEGLPNKFWEEVMSIFYIAPKVTQL